MKSDKNAWVKLSFPRHAILNINYYNLYLFGYLSVFFVDTLLFLGKYFVLSILYLIYSRYLLKLKYSRLN